MHAGGQKLDYAGWGADSIHVHSAGPGTEVRLSKGTEFS